MASRLAKAEGEVQCITQHERFQPVVLDVHVLNTAYYNYRHQYGCDRCSCAKHRVSLLLYANESSQICPFLAVRPQFESVHHQNRRLSSHSYYHESVIFFVFLGLIFLKLRRVCIF